MEIDGKRIAAPKNGVIGMIELGDIVDHPHHGRGQLMRFKEGKAVVFFYATEREKVVEIKELMKC